MPERLAGKVALISGAARGQGAAEARLFAAEGAKVVLGDILDAEGRQVAEVINGTAEDLRAVYVHLDVTRADQWENAVEIAERDFGGLDVLVNNAGVLGMGGVEDTTEEEWDRIIAINQKGVWLGMKGAIGAMRRRGSGAIVNISSILGQVGCGAATAYQSTKGAVRIMTKTAAAQYALENIRVNSVHPGLIASPMTEPLPQEVWDQFESAHPMKRAGRAEEVANAVLFLASDESSFITGAELNVDGGYTAV
jgi:cyclopentanol dehydrogenase